MCECVIVEGKTGGIRLKWGNVVPKEGGGEREGQGARLNKTFMSIPQSGGRLPFPSQTMHFIFMHCCLIAELSLIWELGRGISINVKSFGRHYFFFQPPIPQPGGECCSDFCAVGRQRRSPTLLIYCSQGCPLPPPPPPPPCCPSKRRFVFPT